jgi:hypothetical protein
MEDPIVSPKFWRWFLGVVSVTLFLFSISQAYMAIALNAASLDLKETKVELAGIKIELVKTKADLLMANEKIISLLEGRAKK